MEEKIKELVAIAVNCPSGHNFQPWRFKVSGDTLEIHYDSTADQTIYNYKQIGSLISIGALIENLEYLMSGISELEVTYFPSANESHLATVKFSEIGNKDFSQKARTIQERRTNRNPYQISVDHAVEIEKIASQVVENESKARISVIKDRSAIGRISTAWSVNDYLIFNEHSVHSSLFPHIIWTEEDARNKTLGLYIKTLCLPKPVEGLFNIFKHWKAARSLGKIGFGSKVAAENRQLYESASAICGIIVIKENKETYITSGQILQRFWLNLTAMGYSAQMVMGTLYVGKQLNEETTKHFSSVSRDKIKAGYDALDSAYHVEPGEELVVTVRVGKTESVAISSPKLSPQYIS